MLWFDQPRATVLMRPLGPAASPRSLVQNLASFIRTEYTTTPLPIAIRPSPLQWLSDLSRRVMTEYWKQWEGQVIADAFPLQQYLGGDGDHAVFLTEYGQSASQKAAIKIVLGTAEDGELQIQRWS